jgi:phosphoglycerate dehydrogenase-like enzyme
MAAALALARRLPQRYADLARGEFNMWKPVLTLDSTVCTILGFGGTPADLDQVLATAHVLVMCSFRSS